jgi:rod shape-determining protein MreD
MSRRVYYLFFLFISLVLLQVLILNNVLLFGYVNPYLYISFIFIFPFKKNKFPVLSIAFLLGLLVDLFSDSGGAHAFATTFIAYLRPNFFRTIFQKTELDYEFFSLQQESFGKVFNFIVILTFIHHFLLFTLLNFSFQNFLYVITNTLLSGIFTLVLYFLGTFIFSRKQ